MNPTLKLLRLIGSTYGPAKQPFLMSENLLEIYRHSVKNRLSLLFLFTLEQAGELNHLRVLWETERTRYSETLEAVKNISQLLAHAGIPQVLFKTIRPYIFTTADIDVLIFGNRSIYLKAIKTMQNAGYYIKVHGPASTTFQNPEEDFGVDLYEQIAVSHVPYIDKDKLIHHIAYTKLPDGEHIKALTAEADLLTIIAHSIIKENMYTLSEYYSYIYYLRQLNINRFLQLVEEIHLKSSTRTHTAITALLHEAAHGTVPTKLQHILNQLGEERLETSRVTKNDFKMPHKYHLATIIRCLLEIAKEKKTREGIAMQIFRIFDPYFSKELLIKLSNHITRETY